MRSSRVRAAALAAGAIVVTAAVVDVSGQVVVIGALTGLVYAVLAAGLVLVYRATRVINFAHAELGALGAAWLAKLVIVGGWPWFPALVVVTIGGVLVGGALELAIVRRLFHRPRLELLVATIGLSQLLFVVRAVTAEVETTDRYPLPIRRVLEIGNINIFGDGLLALIVMPAIVVGLGVFMNRTPYGIAIRAAAENPDASRLAGISIKRVSTMVWSMAGGIAVLSVVAAAPLTNFSVALPVPATGPTLLLRALAAALIGRLTSLPITLAGGVAVGIVEAVLFTNYGVGQANLALALAIVALVLVRGREVRTETGGTFSSTPHVSAIPAQLRTLPWVQHAPSFVAGLAFGAAMVLPWLPRLDTPSNVQTFALMLVFALIGLSVTVLTGWAGQLSLGQFAFVGCGAAGTTALVQRGMPFAPAVLYATVGTIGIALLVGIPALRVRGLFLAVTTIGFAVATDSFIVPNLIGREQGGVAFLSRPSFGPFDFADQRTYYYLCLAVLVAALYCVSKLRRSGIGRVLIAARENELTAAAFTVSPVRAKLLAFAVSGGLAAVAGGLLAGLFVQVRTDAFGPDQSLRVVAMAIIGGLGSVPGAVLGAIWVIGLGPFFGSTPEVRALTTAPFLLILLLYVPGGFMEIVYRVRHAVLAALARRRPAALSEPAQSEPDARMRPAPAVAASDGHRRDVAALSVRDVTVTFGGLTAVHRVDLDVAPDEIVGLIGSNGAGKTTLMNAISGFVPATGSIVVWGQEVAGLPAHERAALGVGRAFQDARLFGDLTVHESIMVALEARGSSELVPSMLDLAPARRAERAKGAEADEFVALFGLGRYADAYIAALSTGTRRIAELACLLALDARLLLLDEPTAGVAQAETEVFGPLIRRISADLGASVLIIEHDMPLIMSLVDRVYCMGAGRVIASGAPNEVRNNPEVIANYLGTDERAIRRSGATAAIVA